MVVFFFKKWEKPSTGYSVHSALETVKRMEEDDFYETPETQQEETLSAFEDENPFQKMYFCLSEEDLARQIASLVKDVATLLNLTSG